MIANRDKKHDLYEHNKSVAVLAKAMAESLKVSEKLVGYAYQAGLLHDMGKVIPGIQSYLASDSEDESLFNPDAPLHHEIGWAYVATRIGTQGILNALYWTHGKPVHDDGGSYSDREEILQALTSADLAALEGYWDKVSSEISGSDPIDPCPVPDLFVSDGNLMKNTNAEYLIVRACVISADRYISHNLSAAEVSVLANGGDAGVYVSQILTGGVKGTPVCPPEYSLDRYKVQAGCAEAAKDARTVVVRAPAGLGKTAIGLLWSVLRGHRVIWVCPRNVVAESVYKNIKRELEALGLDCTVELYLTGKRQDCNFSPIVVDDSTEEFTADIVVTNIDNVLSPMVNNRVGGRLFLTLGADVVLDEFHEFASDAPMFTALVTYMRARHRVAGNCHTMLLSATPMNLEVLWDTDEKKTLLLPSANSHYPAQHQGTYEVDFPSDFPASAGPGVLSVSNSVSNAQEQYGKGYSNLIHHRYTDQDRAVRNKWIYDNFGKKGTGVQEGLSLSAALVVQAAMDISFLELTDSLCSPESSLQRVGRTDRWGTLQKIEKGVMNPKLHFLRANLTEYKNEAGAIQTVYDRDLRNLWADFLQKALDGKTSVTLDELYAIYNSFYAANWSAVKSYLMELYKKGLHGTKKNKNLGLISFYPVHVVEVKQDGKTKRNGRNLRNPTGSYYYSVQVDGSSDWLGPDDVLSEGPELYQKYAGDSDNNKGLLDTGKMLVRIKALVNAGFTAYQKWVKKGVPGDLAKWFRMARNPETPLPDFTCLYSHELGLFKKSK